MTKDFPTTREVPLVPEQSALLFVDVQNFCAHRKGGEFDGLSDQVMDEQFGYFFGQLENGVVANMQTLQAAFRAAQIEVLYTTIESLTKDGRDRSPRLQDHRLQRGQGVVGRQGDRRDRAGRRRNGVSRNLHRAFSCPPISTMCCAIWEYASL